MFITLPVGMNYRTERLPVVTFSLIGLNTLVYLVSLVCFFVTEGESDDWIKQNLWLIPAQSFWWTYLTSMFVHAGILHLLGNMIYLFLFGACVEDLIGRARFTVFYLVGGLVAELAYIAFTPKHFISTMPMGGASGAIMACLGMYLLLRADADIDFKYWYFFLIFGGAAGSGEFSLPAWWVISFRFLSDLFWAVLGFVYGSSGGGVAFGAHVGGFLGGLALVGIYKLVGQQREIPGKYELIIDPTQAILSVAAAKRSAPSISTSEQPTIFLHDGTEQTGPFTLTEVQSRLHTGAVKLDASYWSEGMSDWESVADLSDRPLA